MALSTPGINNRERKNYKEHEPYVPKESRAVEWATEATGKIQFRCSY